MATAAQIEANRRNEVQHPGMGIKSSESIRRISNTKLGESG
jgi:hypothetical protein